MADRHGINRLFLAGLSLLFVMVGSVEADSPATPALDVRRPLIAIIIDDLGNLRSAGERAVALQGPVACAVLPHTPYARSIAEQAHAAGKEVLLHLPLQPVEYSDAYLGIGTIELDNTRSQLARIFEADLSSVPHTVGVNTHMGSLLTRHPGHMRWLMGEMKRRGNLFFVDSYTTADSVALQLARETGVRATRRDVFLDNIPVWSEIDREFRRLKNLARAQGAAVGIGHPTEGTLAYLEQALPRLAGDGFELVSVARVIDMNLGGTGP